jgi:hypothetical protein
MNETESYVREQDKQEYRKFCMRHIPRFSRSLPPELWHYTSADGLIRILESGQVWSTQIACLNDTLEQRFFGDLIHTALKKRRAQNTDKELAMLFQVADEALADRDFTTAGHFVACFSEIEDDLGQWRGYGGGECGYAVGFRSDTLQQALTASRPGALLLPMSYDESSHDLLVRDVIQVAESYFLSGLRRKEVTDVEKWANDFLTAFALELDIFACLIKHPKFSGEAERRITTLLQAGEHSRLEFRQKRTLLARHLPLDLTIAAEGQKRLPITRIYIGPGPSHQISRISVGDLLLKCGYKSTKVEVSKIPYRMP